MSEPYHLYLLREREAKLKKQIENLTKELESVRGEMGNPLAWKVDCLELSMRAFNCTRTAGLVTVGDIVQMSARDLLMVKNLGRKTLKEISDMLSELGLTLVSTSEEA